MLAIGLMSGTSLDGIDAALCSISGTGKETKCELVAYTSLDIEEELKLKIKEACSVEHSRVDHICELNFELGEAFCKAVEKLCEEANVKYEDIDFIASHGQTIYHISKTQSSMVPSTLQIGEPALLAYKFKTTVVSNFRPMDIAAGGEGAPLVPYTEYILYSSDFKSRCLQNIGGIGNVTFLKKNGTLEDVVSFDTGPGNMMIDEVMQQFFQQAYDKGGLIAKEGEINQEILDELCGHAFFNRKPPKSTGREEFGKQFVDDIIERYKHVDAKDLVATFTYFTAWSIAKSYQDFILKDESVDELIVGGGGAYNNTLLGFLQELLPEIKVMKQEDIGLSSDAKEAIAFVVLGNETLHNRPSNSIKATGAREYVILGNITPNPFGDA